MFGSASSFGGDARFDGEETSLVVRGSGRNGDDDPDLLPTPPSYSTVDTSATRQHRHRDVSNTPEQRYRCSSILRTYEFPFQATRSVVTRRRHESCGVALPRCSPLLLSPPILVPRQLPGRVETACRAACLRRRNGLDSMKREPGSVTLLSLLLLAIASNVSCTKKRPAAKPIEFSTSWTHQSERSGTWPFLMALQRFYKSSLRLCDLPHMFDTVPASLVRASPSEYHEIVHGTFR